MKIEEIGVLVVDDVKAMQVHLKDMLRAAGFRIIQSASGGEEAKKILMEQGVGHIQLVLSDWHMIPTSGLKVLQFVRAEPSLVGMAFIMVTAENTKEQVLQAISEGVDDYLMKPITIDQVNTKIFSTLKKRGLIA